MAKIASSTKPSFLGFYLRNLGANLLGFVVIAILNVFTPLEFFRMQKTFIFTEGGWKLLFLFYPLVLLLVGLLQYGSQYPIQRFFALSVSDESVDPVLKEKVCRRTLNLPFTIALTNVAVYLFVPGCMVISFYFLQGLPAKTCLFIYFRALMIGLITASLSFFLVEEYSRRLLVPRLFPEGRLAATPHTLKIPIARRIRALYGAGTLNPMILLVGTLIFTALEVKEAPVRLEDFVREILIFTLILCAIFVILAFRLNSLVQNSIRNPMRTGLCMQPWT